MEDADGRLSVSERSIPTIEWKDKEADEYDRHRMGYSRQKGTWNNTAVPSGIDSVQYFKGNDNTRFNVGISQTI